MDIAFNALILKGFVYVWSTFKPVKALLAIFMFCYKFNIGITTK